MEQVKVRVSFKNGAGFTTWFNEFNIHRNENDNQIIDGISHMLSDPNEALPYMCVSDIVFIQVIERRLVTNDEAVEVVDVVEAQ